MSPSQRKVLFCTDLSNRSDSALAAAVEAARQRDALLLIVHVAEGPAAYGSGELLFALEDFNEKTLREALNNFTVPEPAPPVDRRLLTGLPGSEITELAREEGVELIVMETHGRTGFARLVLGSVAEYVVRHAPCSVLIVKSPPPKG